jgi:hypothetical protein
MKDRYSGIFKTCRALVVCWGTGFSFSISYQGVSAANVKPIASAAYGRLK